MLILRPFTSLKTLPATIASRNAGATHIVQHRRPRKKRTHLTCFAVPRWVTPRTGDRRGSEKLSWLRAFHRLPWRDEDRSEAVQKQVALRFYHKRLGDESGRSGEVSSRWLGMLRGWICREREREGEKTDFRSQNPQRGGQDAEFQGVALFINRCLISFGGASTLLLPGANS